MAAATIIRTRSKNDHTISVSTVNLGTYATGGVSVTPTQLGLSRVAYAIVSIHSLSGAPNATHYVYDRDAGKILVYTNLGTEVADAVDLSAVTLRVTAFGA